MDSLQADFRKLWQKIKDPSDQAQFLSWISENFEAHDERDEIMRELQVELRAQLALDALADSEHDTVHVPTTGKWEGHDDQNTVHVDAFLYDDDVVDELADSGELQRNYCKQCGSHDVVPLNFVSHSFSLDELKFLFLKCLPEVAPNLGVNDTLVDIGSRLGIVLYAGHTYSKIGKLVGIEINSQLCKLQHKTIQQYQFDDKCTVIEGDVKDHATILSQASVVVMHNVFEFFASQREMNANWKFVRSAITQPGTILIASPRLEESGLAKHEWGSWVEEVPLRCQDPEDESAQLFVYRVKPTAK